MPQLRRPDVLEAALELLDETGLDGLSMRKLAVRLGVQSGAVFWHFETRLALLEAMADRLLEGVAEIDTTASGLEQLEEIGWRLRAGLKSRRDGARVVAGTFIREPNTLAVAEAGTRAVAAAGLAPERATLLLGTLQYYVLGQTIEEQALEEQAIDLDQQPAIDAERYPARASVRSLSEFSADERFAYGLGLILDGVRADIARAAAGGE